MAGRMPALPVTALPIPSLPNIDTEGGLARFVGNEKRYQHWLLEFAAEAPNYAVQMRQNLADDNPEAARKSAHAIKGRVGMLGMTGLHPIVSALETALKAGEPVTDLLAQMEATALGLCAEIEAAFGANTPASEPAKAATANAPDALPAGPPPESVAQLIALLRNADGESPAAALRCLTELQRTDWGPHLQQAQAQIRRFDFDAALQLLAHQEKVD
jgi:HPt (histidine-containing phosphotransfer) domain-containing protein